MTRIALVVSDVDGTLLTKDKILTDGAKAAVRKLHEAGIGFTIVSSVSHIVGSATASRRGIERGSTGCGHRIDLLLTRA